MLGGLRVSTARQQRERERKRERERPRTNQNPDLRRGPNRRGLPRAITDTTLDVTMSSNSSSDRSFFGSGIVFEGKSVNAGAEQERELVQGGRQTSQFAWSSSEASSGRRSNLRTQSDGVVVSPPERACQHTCWSATRLGKRRGVLGGVHFCVFQLLLFPRGVS